MISKPATCRNFIAYFRTGPEYRKEGHTSRLHGEFLRMRRRGTDHPRASLEFSEPLQPPISVDLATTTDPKTLLTVLLRTLDEKFKAPPVLFYKEIAAALEAPLGAVMSRLARGKQMHRQRLEQKRDAEIRKNVPLRRAAQEGGIDG